MSSQYTKKRPPYAAVMQPAHNGLIAIMYGWPKHGGGIARHAVIFPAGETVGQYRWDFVSGLNVWVLPTPDGMTPMPPDLLTELCRELVDAGAVSIMATGTEYSNGCFHGSAHWPEGLVHG